MKKPRKAAAVKRTRVPKVSVNEDEKRNAKSPDSVMMGLVAFREWCELSQEGMSEKLVEVKGGRFNAGTSKSVVNRLEKGLTAAGYDHMQAYAEVFGVAVGAFFATTHMVSRLRDGDTDNLLKYAEGLEAIANLARSLSTKEPFAEAKDQKEIFFQFFELWLERGLDMSREEAD